MFQVYRMMLSAGRVIVRNLVRKRKPIVKGLLLPILVDAVVRALV